MVRHCADRPSPMCHGLIEHQLGGAVSRVDHHETAFDHRDVEYSFMAIGQCADPADAQSCIGWARVFWEAMQPHSTGGVYVNYLGREDDEGTERVRAALRARKVQAVGHTEEAIRSDQSFPVQPETFGLTTDLVQAPLALATTPYPQHPADGRGTFLPDGTSIAPPLASRPVISTDGRLMALITATAR